MHEPEFENYLALLTGLLRLSGKQRGKIATEMQDHLQQQTEDLLAEGLSRQEAVPKALADFGNAAGLASELTRIARRRRRRLIMRLSSIVVVAAVTAALVVVACFAYAKDRQTAPSAEAPARTKYIVKGTVSSVGSASEHRLAALNATAWEGQVANVGAEDDNLRVTMETVVRPDGKAETEFRLVRVLPLARPRILQKVGQKAVVTMDVDGKKHRFEVSVARAGAGS